MKNLLLGNLSLDQPRVVGTVSSIKTFTEFSSSLNGACDVLEARIDQITAQDPHAKWLIEAKRLENMNIPVLATIRLAKDGGKWADEKEASRLPILRQALENLSSIDVEYDSAIRDELCELALQLNKTIVISYHDFAGTPDIDSLSMIVENALRCPNAISKIATMVKSKEDLESLKRVLEKYGKIAPLCIIGMGSLGVQTRTDFPLLGSKLTYGYIDSHSAPGQLASRDLVTHLRDSRVSNPNLL